MKKRILSLALVVVMVALVAAGSMAYFTDTKSVTNTMTIGNVSIAISENTYDYAGNTGWHKFGEEGFELTLYPVGTDDYEARKATNQLHNKYVQTKNTSASKDDVYIRTIIAVEHIESDNVWGSAVGVGISKQTCEYNVEPKVMTFDNKTYDVYVCTALNGAAIEYGKTLDTLQSVWLYDNVTQKEVEAAGDLEILVLSQGIQAAGLTHEEAMTALGEVNEENLGIWF